LMVLDDGERGIPVAHCLSNHEDTETMEVFFKTLLAQVQGIETRWFLSDDASAFYNAWTNIVGGSTQKLLCIWHVLKNVNRNIQSLVHNAEVSAKIKSCFRGVMYSHNHQSCQDAIAALRVEAQPFPKTSAYLEGYYLNRIHQWALIHRVGSRMSTSGHIESFHRYYRFFYQKLSYQVRKISCGVSSIHFDMNHISSKWVWELYLTIC
jgi:MULE transposase domain